MLELRKISKSDLGMIMEWRMNPEVTKYMYTDPKLTMESQLRWFEHISMDSTSLYWIIKFDGVDIGLLSLYDIDVKNLRCSWAYYLGDQSMRGKGLGRELECNIYDYVFYKLNLEKLWCEVFAFNDKVVKIHEHFGSRREGFYRNHIIKNGEHFDVVAMAILKDEWQVLRKGFVYNEAHFE